MKRKALFDQITALKNAKQTACEALTDEIAIDCLALFPVWKEATAYTAGARIRYGEHLYRCVQGHTAQAGWTPDVTPALWTEVAKPGEIPVWKQPTGAQDAYQTGDKVHYPGQSDPVYESTVDNNVWQPGVYGWQLID